MSKFEETGDTVPLRRATSSIFFTMHVASGRFEEGTAYGGKFDVATVVGGGSLVVMISGDDGRNDQFVVSMGDVVEAAVERFKQEGKDAVPDAG